MAKRKADELEDFTVKHESDGVMAGCKKEDVEEGSAMLRDLLLRWKAESEGLSGNEMAVKMKELVMADKKLLENPFFKSVKAL
jgi:DNA mismatch repair protein MSH2